MVEYKLHYWDARLRGEFIRQILHYGGIPFEDVRIKRQDWPILKSKMTFGQIPVLEVDGKQLPQSYAIARFLAKKCDLVGSDDFASAQVDAYADQFKDFLVEVRPFTRVLSGVEQGNLEEKKQQILLPAIYQHLPFFERAITSSGFLVGDSLTWVDILVAEHLTTIGAAIPEEMKKFPKVLEHSNKIHNIPKIKEWIDSRK